MKRIVLCFDGTWNEPADDGVPPGEQVETNVRRFYESVRPQDDNGVTQAAWYNPGVGTEWYNKVTGGLFGTNLSRHILDGYRQLVDLYEDGDEIYITGFSRGAYTARSLVGMLRNVGLVRRTFGLLTIGAAYGIYRTRGDAADSETASDFRKKFSREVSVKFLGVWDTVGALGIPLHVVQQHSARYYEFHDTKLSTIVHNAYQAIALDEHRVDYDICLWDPTEAPRQHLEQRWFCGAHCDVGGGYQSRLLSDMPLLWMQQMAAAQGLAVDLVSTAPANLLGAMTDSYLEFLGGKYAKLRPRHLRKVLTTRFGKELLDEGIASRRGDKTLKPAYAPLNAGLPPL